MFEHIFVGELMRVFWQRRWFDIELLKPQVDNGGYDLVIQTNAVVRHIQLKSKKCDSKQRHVSVGLHLAGKPSGCVVIVEFDSKTLQPIRYGWFGASPGRRLPDIDGLSPAKHTKGDAKGVKRKRFGFRNVPVSRFEKLDVIDDVVDRLFGESTRNTQGQWNRDGDRARLKTESRQTPSRLVRHGRLPC
jgi:hypothetical protein